jgi:hypothetical protein
MRGLFTHECDVIVNTLQLQAEFAEGDAHVHFLAGDATALEHEHRLTNATHIYMFDKVFTPETHQSLLPQSQKEQNVFHVINAVALSPSRV